MRGVDRGESFVVTRNGVPVAELVPLRRRRFVSVAAVVAAFAGAAPIDAGVSGSTSTASSIRASFPVAEPTRRPRGLIDTSVVIDLGTIDPDALPEEIAVSAITMAELAAGPHAADDPEERGRRQDRLQRAEATFDPLPFDAASARAYGRVYAAVLAGGRKARGARAVDLLIAATALAADLPLVTRNAVDFRALEGLIDVVAVPRPS